MTTVNLSPELSDNLRRIAEEDNTSLSVLVETVLEGYFEEDESDENVVELMQALQEALDEDPPLTLTYHNSADLLNAILDEPELYEQEDLHATKKVG